MTTSDGEVNLSADNFKITYKQNGEEVVPLHAGSYDVMLTYIGNEYDAADYNCTLVITPKPITVTAQQVESTYGDTEKPLVYSSVGLVDGDGLKGFLTREQGDNVGGYDIILGSVANSDYVITYIGAKYVISPKSATVAIGNKEKNYGEANPTFTLITSGLLDSDELAGYSFVCGATAESVVGRYEIDIVNYQDENYIFTVTKGTLTVNKRALTVTADAATATYGETPTLSYRTEGLIVGDKIDGKPECLGKHVGIWDVSVGTLTAGDNYDLRFIPSKLTINKKSLTMAIKQRHAKTYGEDNPPFEYVIDGFAYGDIEADLSGRIIIECLADKFSAVGEYVVSISGVSSADYDVTFVNNILSVGRKTVYVKADGETQLYGNEAVELTYIPDGLINGDLLLGKLQRVAGENVGQYDILVGTLNNNNYSIVYTGAKYTISRAPLTVTVVSVSKRYGEDNPVDKYGYSAMGFKRGDTKAQLDETALQYVTSVDKSTKAGTYAITLTGLTAANYDVSVIAGIFEVTESSIEITIAESYLNVTYDGAAKPVVANATEAGDFSFRYEYNGQNVPPRGSGQLRRKGNF